MNNFIYLWFIVGSNKIYFKKIVNLHYKDGYPELTLKVVGWFPLHYKKKLYAYRKLNQLNTAKKTKEWYVGYIIIEIKTNKSLFEQIRCDQ